MLEGYPVIEIIMVCYTGLVFGSFASALIYRIPRDIPWIYNRKNSGNGSGISRSACPSCQTQLKAIDLIPLLSWAFLRGRCRHCKAPITFIYPLAELITLVGFIVVYYYAGLSLDALFLFLLIPFLVALIFIDAQHYILPDELVGIVGLFGIGHLGISWLYDHIGLGEIVMSHLTGAIVYGLFAYILGFIMTRVLKREALGFGDVKFFVVAGLWLGLADFSLFLMMSGVIGIVIALLWRLVKNQDLFPFGPALIISFFILLFVDGSLLI